MSFFFVFFSHFHLDLNLQSNFFKLFVKFCIFSCDFRSDWANFPLQNCEILSVKCHFFSSIFASISIFNRIPLNSLWNSAFSPVISDLIEWIFPYKIVKFCLNFANFSCQMSFFFFFSSIFTLIWIFNRISWNSSRNCAFSPVISDLIERIFSSKIVKICQNFANFLFQMCFFLFFSSIFTSVWIFNRISSNSSLNSVFSVVIWIGSERIFSCQIVDFVKIWQILSFRCRFFSFFLPFSLRFESSIEFLWIHP